MNAQSPVATPSVPWPDGEVTTLDNGLAVVTGELPHLHTVAVALVVRVGSRYEERSNSGISHLVEHALFRGCDAHPSAFAFNTAVETLANGLSAGTYRDFTVFDASCRPADVSALLALLGSFVSAPRFTDEGVALERKVILQELRDEIDEAGRDVEPDNLTKRGLFGDEGLGLKVGGLTRVVAELGAEDCRAWHERYYGARNMALAVAGPISHAEVVAAAARAFSSVPAGESRSPQPAVVAEGLPTLRYESLRGSQTTVQLTWVLPPEADPRWPALYVAHRLLDDGSCARLRHAIVDERGLAYDLGAELETYEDLSLLTVDASVSHDNAVVVVDAILAEVAGLGSRESDDEEWSRLQRRYARSWETIVDVPEAVASWLGHQTLLSPHDTIARRFARVRSVTRADVAAAARRDLAAAGFLLTVVGDLQPIQRAALRRRVHRLRRLRQRQELEITPTGQPLG